MRSLTGGAGPDILARRAGIGTIAFVGTTKYFGPVDSVTREGLQGSGARPATHCIRAALAIVTDARLLAAANIRYFKGLARYAIDPRELAGNYLPSIPEADPAVAKDSYGFGAQHQVVLRLKPDAYEVCRLLNRNTGFSSAAVPSSKPANSRDGFWKSEDGYRFEYLP